MGAMTMSSTPDQHIQSALVMLLAIRKHGIPDIPDYSYQVLSFGESS